MNGFVQLQPEILILKGCFFKHLFFYPLENLFLKSKFYFICRYTEVANNIQNQETIQTIQFILLDCSPLKLALLSHCQEWQNKFTALLLRLATLALNKLLSYFDENRQKVMVPPETHYDLDSSNKLLESLQLQLPSVEEQFMPLNDQFSVLQKYEVAIPEDVSREEKQQTIIIAQLFSLIFVFLSFLT
jgi:hypothetical protein